jgi:hypothetical protein
MKALGKGFGSMRFGPAAIAVDGHKKVRIKPIGHPGSFMELDEFVLIAG